MCWNINVFCSVKSLKNKNDSHQRHYPPACVSLFDIFQLCFTITKQCQPQNNSHTLLYNLKSQLLVLLQTTLQRRQLSITALLIVRRYFRVQDVARREVGWPPLSLHLILTTCVPKDKEECAP